MTFWWLAVLMALFTFGRWKQVRLLQNCLLGSSRGSDGGRRRSPRDFYEPFHEVSFKAQERILKN